MGRAPCCDKANVKKGPWSPEEDAKLKGYIEKYGTGGNWIALPQKIGLKRCGKSCRLRWLNYLRPNIKHGGFTEEEDNIICSLYISIGSRWSIIAAQLPGRTDNDIKNYWNTRLKKKLLGRRKHHKHRPTVPGQLQEPKEASEETDNSPNLQNLSTSALERLQLHMHLQSHQNPFSFYHNPTLWPKMIQALHSYQNPLINGQISFAPQPPAPDHHHQDYSPNPSSFRKSNDIENSFNGFSSSESSFALNTDQSHLLEFDTLEQNPGGIDQFASPGFVQQSELDNLISNKASGFLPAAHQINGQDCCKEIDGPNSSGDNNLMWWTNEFGANPGSLSSWDSGSMLHQSEEMYQEYGFVQGYNMS